MMSPSPEAEYPMEPFEWGLPAVQILFLASPWLEIDFQADHFADFEYRIFSNKRPLSFGAMA